jgi:methylmalonyl-CoA/ethylmalonyl-CoA epimerase
MATRIRHIALSVQDPEGTAAFYEQAFGLKRVGKTTSVLADGVYLSDGYINVALLKYKSDEMAGMKGGAEFVGTHHFGFQVDDADASKKAIEAAGGASSWTCRRSRTRSTTKRSSAIPRA